MCKFCHLFPDITGVITYLKVAKKKFMHTPLDKEGQISAKGIYTCMVDMTQYIQTI